MALAELLLLMPIMAAIGVAVWIRLGRPVLFRQSRPVLHGELFVIYKFCTLRAPGVTR